MNKHKYALGVAMLMLAGNNSFAVKQDSQANLLMFHQASAEGDKPVTRADKRRAQQLENLKKAQAERAKKESMQAHNQGINPIDQNGGEKSKHVHNNPQAIKDFGDDMHDLKEQRQKSLERKKIIKKHNYE